MDKFLAGLQSLNTWLKLLTAIVTLFFAFVVFSAGRSLLISPAPTVEMPSLTYPPASPANGAEVALWVKNYADLVAAQESIELKRYEAVVTKTVLPLFDGFVRLLIVFLGLKAATTAVNAFVTKKAQ